METDQDSAIASNQRRIAAAVGLCALLPLGPVLAHWSLGVTAMHLAAAAIPILALTAALCLQWRRRDGPLPEPDLPPRDRLERAAAEALESRPARRQGPAALLVSLDDMGPLRDRLGLRASEELLYRLGQRLASTLRAQDLCLHIGDGTFGLLLTPSERLDLETVLQITARLQRTAAEPILVGGTQVHAMLSIGFSLPERVPGANGHTLFDAAEAALREAHRNGAGAIRAYSPEIHRRRLIQSKLTSEVADALEQGQIRPWFQPQISTDTGQVSGFEALARWEHPERGVISPGELLPAVEQAGLSARLGEVILHHSLAALKAWDRAGRSVPTVGVNFALADLRNPNLASYIAWELDRLGLAPERLTVEILEDVIAQDRSDIVARNVTSLAQLGCPIDLDDFGTGHASITTIRRFPIHRLKIDRSFVRDVHKEQSQQKVLSAVLTMAERLDLGTIAEGVESVGEHTMLAQLGCAHVQGYAIARPMPFERTIAWLDSHNAKLVAPPQIGRAQP